MNTKPPAPNNVIKWLGRIGMGAVMILLIVTILLIFNTPLALIPHPKHYVFAALFGAAFGFLLALFSFWMTEGRTRSGTKTLRLALPLVSIISSSVIFWVYALIIAGVNDLGHPIWASAIFGVTTLGVTVWAIVHQLRYQARH